VTASKTPKLFAPSAKKRVSEKKKRSKRGKSRLGRAKVVQAGEPPILGEVRPYAGHKGAGGGRHNGDRPDPAAAGPLGFRPMESRMKRWGRIALVLAGLVVAASPWVTSLQAAERPSLRDAPDLTGIRGLIKVEKFAEAITELDKMVAFGAEHADIFNLLAFSQRKSGDLNNAAINYRKALALEPDHLGALEYQGELFVMLKDMPAARANLARLVALCPSGCEEREDLEKAIAEAK
jgi:hypothetical protein